MNESLPAGFDGVYRCKRHPERDAVAPLALRKCAQCHEDAINAYANAMVKRDQRDRLEGKPRYGFARYEDRTDTDREQPKEKIEQ